MALELLLEAERMVFHSASRRLAHMRLTKVTALDLGLSGPTDPAKRDLRGVAAAAVERVGDRGDDATAVDAGPQVDERCAFRLDIVAAPDLFDDLRGLAGCPIAKPWS
ncbi:MAG: hypothetical protein E5X48_10855 [Mesorhizobium sp.]|uniref:hypothetical protein n=1 Tax=Mesorhizobium sp. TaxID=1871066 RepID=UPI0011FD796C|nr:hypothetical protein [Mesorhizobium sp.]TIQ36275.1 MAG: hypothetical protein E5X48_10855 [Mesorhizobium sp.]